MTNNYYALTIGPLMDTINLARNTRDTWASSYLFSYLIKQFCNALGTKGTVLSPAIEVPSNAKCKGAGLFPDRIFMRLNPNVTITDCDAVIDKEVKDFAKKMSNKLHEKLKVTEDEAYEFLKAYLRIVSAVMPLNENSSVIKEFTPVLDALEARSRIHQPVEHEAKMLLRAFTMLKGSVIVNDAFCDKKESFKSLPQISTADYYRLRNLQLKSLEGTDEDLFDEDGNLKDTDDETEMNQLKKDARNAELPFFNYYNYFAVVYADGDNVGKIVSLLKSDEDLTTFSKKMVELAANATEKVHEFGGLPVYMGGDDMFFFAPLFYKGEHIFKLIEKLDDSISNLSAYAHGLGVKELPTLTFSVAIGYYKFPLYETRKVAFEKLFFDLKSKQESKNSVGVQFRKHSGQAIPFVLPKYEDGVVFNGFIQLVDNLSSGELGVDYLNSLVHKLKDLKPILSKIKIEHSNPSEFEERICIVFSNYFDEVYKKYEVFFNAVAQFISTTAFAMEKHEGNTYFDKTIEITYAALRFVHFMQQEESLNTPKNTENEPQNV